MPLAAPSDNIRDELIQRHGFSSQGPHGEIIRVIGRIIHLLIYELYPLYEARPVYLKVDIENAPPCAAETEPFLSFGYRYRKLYQKKALSRL